MKKLFESEIFWIIVIILSAILALLSITTLNTPFFSVTHDFYLKSFFIYLTLYSFYRYLRLNNSESNNILFSNRILHIANSILFLLCFLVNMQFIAMQNSTNNSFIDYLLAIYFGFETINEIRKAFSIKLNQNNTV